MYTQEGFVSLFAPATLTQARRRIGFVSLIHSARPPLLVVMRMQCDLGNNLSSDSDVRTGAYRRRFVVHA